MKDAIPQRDPSLLAQRSIDFAGWQDAEAQR